MQRSLPISACCRVTTFAWIAVAVLLAPATFAQSPPEAPAGYQWVRNEAFSDEFNGDELDATKWHDHNPRWGGRPPGKFMPSSVSVKDGYLQIKSTPYKPATEKWTIACGAVQSKAQNALYGYYECRMKASSVSTSSTFWLTSNRKQTPYGSMSFELDIQECVGNAKRWKSFSETMHSNTHINLYPNKRGEALVRRLMEEMPLTEQELKKLADATDEEREAAHFDMRRQLKRGAVSPLRSPVDEEFHTYGCWWVDANTIHFYADGKLIHTIEPRTDFDPTPFDHPMFMNLVCETYDWEIPPTEEELEDDSINTTMYDYIRSYTLERIR